MFLILRLREGEFGFTPKFTDPQKTKPKKILIKRIGPFYRVLKNGINILGICEANKCLAKDKQVIDNFRYGIFGFFQDKEDNIHKCPAY